MAVAVVILVIGVLLMFLPKVKQMNNYRDRRDKLQHRIEITENDEQELKNKQQRFLNDPIYVERVAHAVGYAHKDDLIYHFSEETGTNEPNF